MIGLLAAVLGGLMLLGATAADWVTHDVTRTVGGVVLTETIGTPGTVFAGAAFGFGLGIVVIAFVGLVLRGKAVPGMLMVAGVLAGGIVVAGIMQASDRTGLGDLTPWPWLALAASVAVVLGGWQAGKPRPARSLGARYDIDDADDDEEWNEIQ